MSGRLLMWGAAVVVWLGFTFWYTDFGGPLSDDEITEGLQQMEAGGLEQAQLDRLEGFLRADEGGQFLMVNIIDMNDSPGEMPGFDSSATADDYLNHYMEHMYVQLLSRACHPTFAGLGLGIVADIHGVEGPAASGWDRAALMRYRSRRSFLEVIMHPDMQDRHDYKLAGMTKTLAYPVEPVLYLADLRLQLFLVLGLIVALTDILVFGRRKT